MRARRKKKYQARREARAQHFYDKEVVPLLQRTRDEAFRAGMEKGRLLELEAAQRVDIGIYLADSKPYVDLDLTERRLGRRAPTLTVHVENLSQAPMFSDFDPVLTRREVVEFDRIQMGIQVGGSFFRWSSWRPRVGSRSEKSQEDPLPLDTRFVFDMLSFIKGVASGAYYFGGRTNEQGFEAATMQRARLFLDWARTRGVEVRDARAITPRGIRDIDDDLYYRWSQPGGWR